jgi:putative membrane protein
LTSQKPPPSKPPVQPPAAQAPAQSSPSAPFWAVISRMFSIFSARGRFSAPRKLDKTSNNLAQDRTDMATSRTLMAADRSLMAWVRTALSMISFGFTIYKILQGLASSGVALGAAAQPRTVGLFLIGMGVFAILMGTVEYLHRAQDLAEFQDVPIWRPSLIMAALMSLLSVCLFIALIFRAL